MAVHFGGVTRRSKFTDIRILEILQAVEGGLPVPEVLQKHGISRATFFTWKRKYGGATVAERKRVAHVCGSVRVVVAQRRACEVPRTLCERCHCSFVAHG